MPRRITPCIISSLFISLFIPLFALASNGQNKVLRAEAKAESKAKDTLDPETKLVLDSVSKRYEKIKSWEATFNQIEKSPGFAEPLSSEGYFKFVAPNKFHIATRGKSLIKKFVSNGKGATYIEDKGKGSNAERYFARKFSNAKNLELERYLLFFRGLAAGEQLGKEFKIKGKFKKPNLELTLIPNGESDFSEVTIVFHNSENFPKELLLKDALGGETQMKIIEAKTITKADPTWFDLSVPKGATIEK
ncbi:MAG: outer membrane lipoprotein carrier protein LolA [Bdellovibrionota bacterium]